MPKRTKNKAKLGRAVAKETASEHAQKLLEFDRYNMNGEFRSHEIVELVRQGSYIAPEAIFNQVERGGRDSLVQAGVIIALLDFLQSCRSSTMEHALIALSMNKKQAVPYVVVPPHKWTNALLQVCTDQHLDRVLADSRAIICRLQTLVKCMCDPRQQFFKSHEEWLRSIPLVVGVIIGLASSPEAVNAMLEHDEIPEFLVQCLCLRQCRPDIAQEIAYLEAGDKNGANSVKDMGWLAPLALHQILKNVANGRHGCGPGVECITRLANTKASFSSSMARNKDTSGSKTLATCLIDVIDLAMSEGYGQPDLFYILRCLISIDVFPVSEVITKSIEWGTSGKVVSSIQAKDITLSLYETLNEEMHSTQLMPNDSRYAHAIQAGLFEMCLDFTVSFGTSDQELAEAVKYLLKTTTFVDLERKSSKAIRKRAPMIRAKIAATLRVNNTSGVVLEITNVIQAILQTSLAANSGEVSFVLCQWCSARMAEDDCKQCSACQSAYYCSKECQKQDWQVGDHKHHCKSMGTMAIIAKQKGLGAREIRNAARLEENTRRAAKQFFKDSTSEIMAQATLKGLQILHCVIVFNFADTPVPIMVLHASHFLENEYYRSNLDRCYHAQRTIEHNRENGALTLACISPGHGSLVDMRHAMLIMTVPYASSGPTFDVLQEELSRDVFVKLNVAMDHGLKDNLDARAMLLE